MNRINYQMWGRALQTIPRISKEEWFSLDIISKWLIATRSAVFIMTAIAGCIGGFLAWQNDKIIFINFVVAVLGIVFAHAANNLLNDFIDSKKGIDKGNYYRSLYGPQTIEHGLLSQKAMLTYISISLFIALICGSFLIVQTGEITLYLMLIGLFFLLFYTWPLKYIGLGELTVALVWGPLMVGGTYFVSAGGEWNWTVANIGLIYALGPTSVLFGKHTDKLKEDRAKRVFTLPVILGESLSRWFTMFLWISQFLLVAWLIINQYAGFSLALVVFAFPKLINTIKVYAKPRPASEPKTLEKGIWPLYLSAHAFAYNKRFGVLFLLGLLIDLILVKSGLLS